MMDIKTKLLAHLNWAKDLGYFHFTRQGCCEIASFHYKEEEYLFVNVKKDIIIALDFIDGTEVRINKRTVLKAKAKDLVSRSVITLELRDGIPYIEKSFIVSINLEILNIDNKLNLEDLNLLENLENPYVLSLDIPRDKLKYFNITNEEDRVTIRIKDEFKVNAFMEKRVLLHSKFVAPNHFFTCGNKKYVETAIDTVYQNVRAFKQGVANRLEGCKHQSNPDETLREISNLLDRLEKL